MTENTKAATKDAPTAQPRPTKGAAKTVKAASLQGVVRRADRIAIEHVTPELDGGRWPVKREVGDRLAVEADIFRDNQDVLNAAVLYRAKGEAAWREAPMVYLDNDRWAGEVPLEQLGRYEYTLEAWSDDFATWRRDMGKRLEAAQDVASEYLEGVRLIEAARERGSAAQKKTLDAHLKKIKAAGDPSAGSKLALDSGLFDLMRILANRSNQNVYDRVLEVVVDRVKARFAAWYELFPRSYGESGRHGTFRDVIGELPRIAAMGFDTLYLPPIHPIGRTNRKGRNNSLVAGEGDPGSPWAIGAAGGGHTAVHPELGTLEDFRALIAAAGERGIEVAIDFAIQASPDHPWVKDHPGYFFVLPDGHIKYAENPPKKYEDIYPINFFGTEAESLWLELEATFEFWIGQGVKTFRVDNPHTKALNFWDWALNRIKARHPETIFLAEAFTRPRVMERLAKVGFTQSYSYFTWRTTKPELEDYFTELTQGEKREYYRANLWPNTPDILTDELVEGGLGKFRIRFLLAATLSSVYGIYSGYEVGDNDPFPGKEEYNNNEKYQLRTYDWNAPGNLVDLITRVNRVRRDEPALQEYDNLSFLETSSDQIIAYTKVLGDDVIVCVVSLDPHAPQEGWVRLPLWQLGVEYERPYSVRDLLSGATYRWSGEWNYVRLDPHGVPGHILKLERP